MSGPKAQVVLEFPLNTINKINATLGSLILSQKEYRFCGATPFSFQLQSTSGHNQMKELCFDILLMNFTKGGKSTISTLFLEVTVHIRHIQ